jgi:hypothetical protein
MRFRLGGVFVVKEYLHKNHTFEKQVDPVPLEHAFKSISDYLRLEGFLRRP